MRIAVIDTNTQTVINIGTGNGKNHDEIPNNTETNVFIASEEAKIGDTYSDGVFTSPVIESPALTPREQRQAAFRDKWFDAYDLIDDILTRSAETVKAERDQIRSEYPDV